MNELTDRIAFTLAAALNGAPVKTGTDANGVFITRESAIQLAELIATDVVEELGLHIEDG